MKSKIHLKRTIPSPAMQRDTIQEIERVRQTLRNKPRNLLLFDLVKETDLRMEDLLRVKVRDLIHLNKGERIQLFSRNSKSVPTCIMTETIFRTLQLFLSKMSYSEDDYIFKSRKGSRPLTISTASHLIKKWTSDAGLDGLSGIRSLRKAWQHYENNNEDKKRLDKRDMLNRTLKPINSRTLQDKVYKQLLQAIVSGKIPPGVRLTAKELALQMNVSQMPIREALLKLDSLGYISTNKTGILVSELSRENLEEIFDIRLMLELRAVTKACLYSTEKTLLRLEALHDQFLKYVQRQDVEELLRVNREFHFAIYEESKMPILLAIIDGLWDRVSPYLHIFVANMTDYAAVKENHTEILDGMKLKDPKKTCKWLQKDLIEAADFLRNEFKRQKDT